MTTITELSLLIDICMPNDLTKKIDGVMFFIEETAFVFKLILFMWNINELNAIENMLEDFNSYNLKFSDLENIKENLKEITYLRKTYRTSCFVCSAFYAVPPLLRKDVKYALPYSTYLPYDITNNFTYVPTFIYQVGSVLVSAHLNTMIDMINIKLVTLGSCLLQVLMNKLKDIGINLDEDDSVKYRECLILHNKILRFVEKIEKLYCYITFAQLSASATVICFSAFGLAIVPVGSGEFDLFLIYLINMITQVALYCWAGHNMRALSEDLSTACYMSKWYKTDTKTKKMMILFMERTKRPLTLTAAKMFPMTLTTLTSILRSSYSYFAVLQRVYSDH
ncbi:odorant receptor 43a-like [Sitophilus oryzae]|uniref:Odorant receptor 43a-like n=1 Tax=Sitophilus oryzae TaxID=7048 RepID=A0A6J2XRR7_SITOR|nr:odorant receptor 43a-like [Sitophilus oryzae]